MSGFDPAAAGWTQRPSAIGTLVGPFWSRRVGAGVDLGLLCGPRHDNGRGRLHGGLLGVLADQGMGAAVRADAATGDPDGQFATVQLDVAYLRAVEIGAFVTTAFVVRHRTGRLAFVAGTLRVGDVDVASAQGVFSRIAAGPR